MKNILYGLLIPILLSGCRKEGTPVYVNESRDNFEVKKLFAVDGITVYRFVDNGRCVYFTNRTGKVDSIVSTGKTIYHTETLCNNEPKEN